MPLKVPMGFEMFGTERRNPQGPSSAITRRAWRGTGLRPSLHARELAGRRCIAGGPHQVERQMDMADNDDLLIPSALMETEAVLANEVGLLLLRKLREKVSAA